MTTGSGRYAGQGDDPGPLTNGILKVPGLGHVSDLTRGVGKHVATEGDHRELDELDELEDDEEAAQRKPGEPIWPSARCQGATVLLTGALLDVGALDLYKSQRGQAVRLPFGISFNPLRIVLADLCCPICTTTAAMAV